MVPGVKAIHLLEGGDGEAPRRQGKGHVHGAIRACIVTAQNCPREIDEGRNHNTDDRCYQQASHRELQKSEHWRSNAIHGVNRCQLSLKREIPMPANK